MKKFTFFVLLFGAFVFKAQSQCSTTITYTDIVTPTSCSYTCDGSVTVNGSGGSATLQYTFSTGLPSGNFDGSLCAGVVNFTITDGLFCTTTGSASITSPAAISITGTATSPTCAGGNNGSIFASATGGSGTLSYAWFDGTIGQTDNNLSAGAYTVTVSDANGCTAAQTFIVSDPAGITISLVSELNPLCPGDANGSITVTASGGSGTLSYEWPDATTGTTDNNLAAGSYVVTVTDGNLCTATANYVLTDPTPITVVPTLVDATCGINNGSITLSVTGGAGNYTYDWGAGTTTLNYENNLGAGTYGVTVYDANGCSVTESYDINTSNLGPTITPTLVNPFCPGSSDGSISLSVSGGDGTYFYVWGDATTASSETGLSAGTYFVTVTDNGGCSSTANFTLTDPTAMSVVAVITNPSCNGSGDGTITVTVTGGAGGYSYDWGAGTTSLNYEDNLSGGVYDVTVYDANGCSTIGGDYTVTDPAAISVTATTTDVSCNGAGDGSVLANAVGGSGNYVSYDWTGGGSGNPLTGLSGGGYSVTVTDDNGCTGTGGAFTVNEPTAVSIGAPTTVNPTSCTSSDGSITVSASGGTPSYSYDWSNGGSGSPLTGIGAGLYTVTATDNNGCTATASATLTAPNAPSISNNTVVDVSCNGGSDGSVTITATGGAGNFTYAWSAGGSTTNSATGLSAGTYNVTVTDGGGCQAFGSYTVNEPSSPLAITTQPTVTNPTSCSSNDGSISGLVAGGGTAGYSYSWSNGATTADISSLGNATYTITVTDLNSCSVSAAYNVVSPGGISLAGTVSSTCQGSSSGSIDVTVTGGTPGFTYSWNPNETGANPTGLASGTYLLTVTDNGGCSSTASYTVGTIPTSSSSISASICNGATYNFNGTSETASGTYTATLTAASGCDSIVTLTLSVSAAAATANNNGAICPGASYTFNGITYNAAGTYFDTLSNVNGCDSVITTVVVTQIAPVSTTINANIQPGQSYDFYGEQLTQTGTYDTTIVAQSGCDSIITLNLTVVGINDLSMENAIALYPNPASDVVILSSSLFATGEVTPSVYDVTGKEVAVSYVRQANKFTFDTRELASGMYWVKVVVNGNEATKKFVKIN